MKYIYTLILFCFSICSFAQNLVLNPGFESANYKPAAMLDEGRDFTRYVQDWVSPNYASPDFITSKFRSTKIKTITPHSGENMIGLVVQGPHWGEYISMKLRSPLEVGQKYYIEFWISSPEYYAKRKTGNPLLSNQFGVLFHKKIFETNTKVIQAKPQIIAPTGTTIQPEKWIKVNGSFIADEPHSYLFLGQFKKEETDDIKIGYYFIDDVFVEKIEKEALQFEPSKSYQIRGKVASIILENIYFETDKYQLLPESFTELNKLVNIMLQNKSMTIEIHGHTDDQGDEIHNQELSENRAKSVLAHLKKQGIIESRMSIKAFGLSKPIDTNETNEGRKRNRRVEFVTNSQDTISEGFIPADIAYQFSKSIKDNPFRLSKIGKDERFWNCESIGVDIDSEAINFQSKTFSQFKPENAKSFILQKTKNQKAVFLQIQPEYENQLVFVYTLLEELHQQGFKHLVFENIEDLDVFKNSNHPTLKQGQIFQHPLYGSILRKAKELGFNFSKYRPTPSQIDKAKSILKKDNFQLSEIEQKRAAIRWSSAMNINRIVAKNPDDKILVLHSFFKKEDSEINKTMLNWFKKFSKIKPFTIVQSNVNSKCSIPNSISKKIKNTSPTVYTKDDKAFKFGFFQNKENKKLGFYADLEVFHPVEKHVNNRPKSLTMNGIRKSFNINIDKFKMNYPCLIFAYQEGDDVNNGIPIDIIERNNNLDNTTLILPKGNYSIVLRDESKRKKLNITVE